MCILRWFKKEKRDRIGFNTIRPGSVLKVYPSSRDHVKNPYLVLVTQSGIDSFTTELINPFGHPDPHSFTFVYKSEGWRTYHRFRFQILKY